MRWLALLSVFLCIPFPVDAASVRYVFNAPAVNEDGQAFPAGTVFQECVVQFTDSKSRPILKAYARNVVPGEEVTILLRSSNAQDLLAKSDWVYCTGPTGALGEAHKQPVAARGPSGCRYRMSLKDAELHVGSETPTATVPIERVCD